MLADESHKNAVSAATLAFDLDEIHKNKNTLFLLLVRNRERFLWLQKKMTTTIRRRTSAGMQNTIAEDMVPCCCCASRSNLTIKRIIARYPDGRSSVEELLVAPRKSANPTCCC